MNPYVGIIISLAVFGIGTWLFKKSKGFFLFTPLFVAMILGVVVLKVTGISYEQYNEGGKYISFFLEPATVAFAIPLYKKRRVEKILVRNFNGVNNWFFWFASGCLFCRKSDWHG